MKHGNHGNADVHFRLVDADLDAAVLRQALFGDVQVAQNLDAREDGRLELLQLRRHGDVLQNAVNAVTNLEFLLERFQVNVRRAQFNGIAQDLIDEPDDRGVLRGGIKVVAVLGIVIDDLQRFFLAEGVDGVGADAETLLHLALDDFGGGQDGLEVQAGDGLAGVESLGGEEAADGDFHGAVDALEREDFLLKQQARGEQGEQLAIRLDVLERGEGQAVFMGEPAQDGLFGGRGRNFSRASAAASIEDNCLAATIRSSRGFNPGSEVLISLI